MSSYKKFTKDVGLISIVNFVVIIKSIIFLPLITKMLGVLNYGIWTQLLVTVALLSPVVRLGLPNSIVRYIAAEKNKEDVKEGIYSTMFLITILSSIILLLFLIFITPLTQFFQAPTILILILPLIILFECLISVLLTAFQAMQEMGKYSFFSTFGALGEIALVITSIIFGYGIKGAIFSILLSKLMVFSFLYLHTFRLIGFKIPRFNLIKKYLLFGLPTLLSNTSYLAVTSIDKYLVGWFLGTLFVGYYAPAYSLGNFIAFLIIPISFVLFPAVSKSYDENKMHEVKNKLKYSLKYFLIFAIPSVVGISFLSKNILEIFTTQEIALQAFFVTPLVAGSILFYGVSDIFSEILTLVKKTKIVGFAWTASAILNIVLNIILIPNIGIMGAAIATLAAYLLAFLFIWYYSKKEFSFDIDWRAILKSCLGSFFMVLLIVKINPHGLFATILTIFLAAIIYLLAIIMLKIFDQKELLLIKSFLKN